jgi:hypothetical protein
MIVGYARYMTDDAVVRFKDFSLSPEPIVFRIAPDNFECIPEIPIDSLMDLAALSVKTDDRGAQFKRVTAFFTDILTFESGETFMKRTRRNTPDAPNLHPIGMRHVKPIMDWLMEMYGLRPTQPSAESVTGSADDDTNSTDGVSSETSTS